MTVFCFPVVHVTEGLTCLSNHLNLTAAGLGLIIIINIAILLALSALAGTTQQLDWGLLQYCLHGMHTLEIQSSWIGVYCNNACVERNGLKYAAVELRTVAILLAVNALPYRIVIELCKDWTNAFVLI